MKKMYINDVYMVFIYMKYKTNPHPTKGPKMLRTQILLEEEQHRQLTEIAREQGSSVSEIIRKLIDTEIRASKRRELRQVAEKMSSVYRTDKELTAFTDLDGEDFLA